MIDAMSKEQKEELVANLLRHRSLHMAYLYGQLKGAIDETGNPVGQGPVDGMAAQSGNQAGMEEIIAGLSAALGPTNMQ